MTFPVVLADVHRKRYFQKVLGLDRDNLIGYWPMGEASGGVAFDFSPEGNDGAYTGVTLGQPGIGDGKTCPLFDGSNDFNDIYSAGFNADFNGAEGTVFMWLKIATAEWENGVFGYVTGLAVDVNNSIRIRKSSVNNRFDCDYIAGGTIKQVQLFVASPPTDWFSVAMTWSAAADKMIAYQDGVKVGTIQTDLGTWAGVLSSTLSTIGSQTTSADNALAGNIAHFAFWKTPLSAAKILKAATV